MARKKKRKNSQAPGRAPDPFRNVIAVRKTGLSRQRASFLGALKHKRGRDHAESIGIILRQCLNANRSMTARHGNLSSLLESLGIPFEEFDALCRCFWPSNLSAGNQVFSILESAGYEGNIDDLWLSVYGIWKPSVIRTEPTPLSHHARRRSKGGQRRSVFVINTGQTRKPGSHKS